MVSYKNEIIKVTQGQVKGVAKAKVLFCMYK